MKRILDKIRKRTQRKRHIRKRISGTSDRPRMTVFRSNKNLYVQIIDDLKGVTIASANTMEKENIKLTANVKSGEKIGEIIGERLKAKKIDQIVFDRNGYLYHGVVKAIADGARKAGIKF